MFLTNILFKKAKSKYILVEMLSAVSGHKISFVRERLGEKAELIRFDPFIQMMSVYREKRKLRSL